MTRPCYTPGYGATATAFMERRTLASHAAFLRPHLDPGLAVLDVGCGPGTITVDIARAVAPGAVVGAAGRHEPRVPIPAPKPGPMT